MDVALRNSMKDDRLRTGQVLLSSGSSQRLDVTKLPVVPFNHPRFIDSTLCHSPRHSTRQVLRASQKRLRIC